MIQPVYFYHPGVLVLLRLWLPSERWDLFQAPGVRVRVTLWVNPQHLLIKASPGAGAGEGASRPMFWTACAGRSRQNCTKQSNPGIEQLPIQFPPPGGKVTLPTLVLLEQTEDTFTAEVLWDKSGEVAPLRMCSHSRSGLFHSCADCVFQPDATNVF